MPQIFLHLWSSMSQTILILCIMFPLFFHNISKSMQEEETHHQQMRIAHFIRAQEHDIELIRQVGQWLSYKRAHTPDYQRWSTIVNFTISVGFCRCDCFEKELTFVIKDTIKKVARELEPGQDCTEQLVQQTQGALITTKSEWERTQRKKIDSMLRDESTYDIIAKEF
jgi:hypothetical protein